MFHSKPHLRSALSLRPREETNPVLSELVVVPRLRVAQQGYVDFGHVPPTVPGAVGNLIPRNLQQDPRFTDPEKNLSI